MGARAMTPKPPPGFEIIPTQQAAVPPPPPGFEIVTAAQPSRPAGVGDGSEVRAYEPTIRERIGGYISDFFGNSAEGDRLAQGVVGSSGLGHSSMAVADFTPARIPMFAQESFRAYNEGRTGAAALAALGATPVPVLNKAVEGAVSAAQPVVEAARNLGTQAAARLPARVTGRSADDVADRVIAGRLQRSGQSADTVAEDLAAGQRSARLSSNSQAELPEMLADTSDDMQRLTGSVYRTGGEASEIVKPRLEGRQRGPENPYAPRLVEGPQGQIERIIDDFDRALEVKSSKGARATASELEAAQRAKADELYTKARAASEPFDLENTLVAWNLKAQQYQGPFRDTLVRAMNLFREPPGSFTRFGANTITRFDNAKKILDDMIEGAKRGGENNLARELVGLKNDLLAEVHRGGKNKLYQQARDEFGTAAENREAIDLGRRAFREDSEVSVDTFRALTPAQQKLFRIGLRDALRLALATKKPGDNATLLLQQRRIRELLTEVIPTPRAKAAEFKDRAERFGDLMRREERMSQTRNAVLGNSATAQRVADDAEFASDTLSRIMTSGRSAMNMGLELVGNQLQKVFGYRRDVAAALARKLTSTDPAERAATLEAIRAAQSPQAFSAFAEGISSAAPRTPALVAPTQQDDGSDITGSAGLDAIGGGAEGDRLRPPGMMRLGGPKPTDPYDQIPITADGNEEAARAAQAKMYEDNLRRVIDRSFVRYGDQVLIPNNIDDAIDMLVSGAAKAGDVLAAFPGVGTLIDDLGNAAGAGLKALRNAPKAPEEIIPGATAEGDAILAARRAAREKEQAAARAAQEQADRQARGAAYQAEAAKRGSTGTVPALSPAKDRAAIVEGLPEGTAPMAIKGRQGMPTRDEQIELVDKYISGGGRVRDLPSGDGPWGSSPQRKAERAQEAIQRAFDKDKAKQPPAKAATVGDEANLPSVKELMEAWKGAKAEADRLRSEIKSLKEKGRDTARLSEELRQTQLDLVRLQQASGYRRRFRTASEVLDGLPPQYVPIEPPLSVPPREAPRIYRKGQ